MKAKNEKCKVDFFRYLDSWSPLLFDLMPALTVKLVAEETFDVDDEEANPNIGDVIEEIVNDDKNIKL